MDSFQQMVETAFSLANKIKNNFSQYNIITPYVAIYFSSKKHLYNMPK